MSGVVANNVRDFYVTDTQQRRRLQGDLSPIEKGQNIDTTKQTWQVEADKAINTVENSILNNRGHTQNSVTSKTITSTLSYKLSSLTASVRTGLHLLNNPLVLNSAILVTYTINCTTIFSSEQLFAQLYTSVSTGAFSEDLFTNANAIGATDMVGVTSLSVAYPCTINCEDKDAHWFWWYTALIATGGFIALIMAVFALQWCYDYYGKYKLFFNACLLFLPLAITQTCLTVYDHLFHCAFQFISSQGKVNSGKLMTMKKITLAFLMMIGFWNFEQRISCSFFLCLNSLGVSLNSIEVIICFCNYSKRF